MAVDALKYRIVFFDGVCNLCNSSVDFLAARDKNRVLKFASLQGRTAQDLLPVVDFSGIVYLRNGVLYRKSSAALKAATDLGWKWQWINVFFIFPKFFRDIIYDWIAVNRYRWFGKRNTCRLPTPNEAGIFLD